MNIQFWDIIHIIRYELIIYDTKMKASNELFFDSYL